MTSPSSAQGPHRATIASIAEETGVSVTTVSKVLNGRPDVAPATRERVEACLARHKYRPRVRRRPLKGQIDLVFHQLNSVWSMEIIRGVDSVAAPAGIEVALSQLEGAHRPPEEWLDGLLDRRPLGVLFVLCGPSQSQQRRLRRQRIPFVVVDSDTVTPASVPMVGSNNWNGGLLATRHLLELGHRRIAVVSGPKDVLCSRARVAGFRVAHDEAGVAVDPGLVRYGNFYVDAGFEHGMDLLTGAARPTAIFAGSDLQALGVLRAARRLGLDVPGELSVVGYDDVPAAAWVEPALTTVHQPLSDMAVVATQMLLDLARGTEVTTSRIDLANELVVRDSTAPPVSSSPA
ncbi:LacI family DNA-binding transcriptional regulator [Microbispora amethystogenes]|uniref:LacI family transcriptional regulator n=1 Tax=Microbispora cellulosiformans TaxID=2614688 RepID=A0A5J5JRQ1_9ACTN|nr:LacI family DNA-binding transcriptional regulator [Microbispora cellulosiformans]KAA9373756.1 LacI family transcriptional regulator [Microbispora cellulosiformans]KAA9375326.1 LacI family transcriptional regulator [Microbispora cellulosiformans]